MRIPMHKPILLVLGVLAALLVAGCGGGGGDETETATTPTVEETTALTKDELIEEGDGICAEVNAAVGALGASESEEASATGDSEKIANLYLGMVEHLQELGTPEGDSGDYAKFMEAAEELGKAEGELKLAAEREDVVGVEEKGGEAAAALESFQSQAAIYGFEDCSDEPGLSTPAGSGTATPGGEEFEGEGSDAGSKSNPNTKNLPPKKKSSPKKKWRRKPAAPGADPKHLNRHLKAAANRAE